ACRPPRRARHRRTWRRPWAASSATRDAGRPRGALRRGAVLRRPAALGRVPAGHEEYAARRWPIGGGVLRVAADRYRRARDRLAVAGPRCLGECAAGLLRRTGREPVGGAALRAGRSRLGPLPAHAGGVPASTRAGQRVQRVLSALLRAPPARDREA